ncbi:hypothetical protein Scep_002597 [Stephania cephalantha]|uniref:Uncharacterized protein n=1 Tax=Stephania cephalantha TaxID=152367 RepID=A0AAP0LAG7_9MAGN
MLMGGRSIDSDLGDGSSGIRELVGSDFGSPEKSERGLRSRRSPARHGGAQLVAEEPNSSRMSPALQSKMGVWPWASMALGKYDLRRVWPWAVAVIAQGSTSTGTARTASVPAAQRRDGGQRRSRRVAVVVDAVGWAAAGSRHGAESAASTAQTADGGASEQRRVQIWRRRRQASSAGEQAATRPVSSADGRATQAAAGRPADARTAPARDGAGDRRAATPATAARQRQRRL